MKRTAVIERETKETKITLTLDIDGHGENKIQTGIGFFDHMLTHISKHGFLDMEVVAQGDIEVDTHHTIEDVGIVFGQGLLKEEGDKSGMRRYGHSVVPMDETLVLCAIDLCGRSYLGFEHEFSIDHLGTMETEMVKEFFRAVSANSGMTLHIKVLDGKNNHHIAEAMFKAFGKALDEATAIDPRVLGALSTKGVL